MTLDASALLALVLAETGFERVKQALLNGCSMSAVNASEAVTRLLRGGEPFELARSAVDDLDGLLVVPFDSELAYEAAALAPAVAQRGMSLADRACIVTARRLGQPVLTADRLWATFDRDVLGVDVELIR